MKYSMSRRMPDTQIKPPAVIAEGSHLNLEPDFEDWCQWAVRAGLRPEIIAFLRFKPALLHDANATSDVNAWPTPRSWEMASNVLTGFAHRQKSGFFAGATEIEAQLLEGTVGLAATTELVATSACTGRDALGVVEKVVRVVFRLDFNQPGEVLGVILLLPIL